MQLNTARLCLDCQEIHEAPACPLCGSESFAYITRWIPAPERRKTVRPERVPEQVETYRQLLAADAAPPRSHRWLTGGALVAAVTVAGWLWRRGPEKAKPGDGPAGAAPSRAPGRHT